MNHIPPDYHTAMPYLIVAEGLRALEFYKQVFEAEEMMRLLMPDGKLGHAEFKVGESRIAVADEFPEWKCFGPKTIGGTPVTIILYFKDCDAVIARAIEAGATKLDEIRDQFYGDRSGKIMDPFGHVWIVATHIEDVSVEEMQKRLNEMCQ